MAKVLHPTYLTLPEDTAVATPPAGFTAFAPLTDGDWDFKRPSGLTASLGTCPIKEIVTPTTVSPAAASVQLTPSSVYPIMRLIAHLSTTSTANEELLMTVNNDTAVGYYTWADAIYNGVTTIVDDGRNQGYGWIARYIDGDFQFMQLDMLIIDGDDSGAFTSFLNQWNIPRAANYGWGISAVSYEVAAAVSTLEFFFSAGNVEDQSWFAMYGYDL